MCFSCFVLQLINCFALQERKRIMYDEQKKLAQHQAQTKSQMAKYVDELARARMQVLNLLKLGIFRASLLPNPVFMYTC